VLLVPYPDTLFFSFFVKYKYCWKFDGNLQYFSRLLFRWTCKIPKRGGTVCVNYVSVPFFFLNMTICTRETDRKFKLMAF
jgi:hypothetical protein